MTTSAKIILVILILMFLAFIGIVLFISTSSPAAAEETTPVFVPPPSTPAYVPPSEPQQLSTPTVAPPPPPICSFTDAYTFLQAFGRAPAADVGGGSYGSVNTGNVRNTVIVEINSKLPKYSVAALQGMTDSQLMSITNANISLWLPGCP